MLLMPFHLETSPTNTFLFRFLCTIQVRIRHPVLFKSVAEHLVGSGDRPEITGRGVEDFSVQGLGNLAWAYARQAQLGAEVISRHDGKTTVPTVSGRLAHYVTSFIDVGEGLLQKLFKSIAEADLQVHGTSFGFFL
jgi:glutamate dehydrogenase/leucine dehydrogenase